MATKLETTVAAITNYGNKLKPYIDDLKDSTANSKSHNLSSTFVDISSVKSSIYGSQMCLPLSIVSTDEEMTQARDLFIKITILDTRDTKIYVWDEVNWVEDGTIISSTAIKRGKIYRSEYNGKTIYVSADSTITNL